MTEVFGHILEMSLYGSIAILCVIAFRALFRKMPKRITCLFWVIVAVRLLCPFNLGSQFSVASLVSEQIPFEEETDMTPLTQEAETTGMQESPATYVINRTGGTAYGNTEAAAAPSRSPFPAVTVIWIAGTSILLTALAARTAGLKRRLRKSVAGEDGTFVTGSVSSPFVTGLLRPRVFMPDILSEKERSFILLHEQTHIRYFDHITKVIGVIAVCIHWFNPLVWLAFILFSRDLEMRVDETVIETMGEQIKKEYCLSLVSFAKTPTVYRILGTAFSGRSFGGSEVKMRINNLINYKNISGKIGALIVISALGASAVLSSCAKTTAVDTAATEDTLAAVTQETQAPADTQTEAAAAQDDDAAKNESIEMALSFLGDIAYDEDSVYVCDYGPSTAIIWNDTIASATAVDPDSFSNEDIRTLAQMYADRGQEIYDLQTITEGHGGTGYHEGFLTCSQSDDGYVVNVVCRTSDSSVTLRTGGEGQEYTVTNDDVSDQIFSFPVVEGQFVRLINYDLSMTVRVGRANSELLSMDFSFSEAL